MTLRVTRSRASAGGLQMQAAEEATLPVPQRAAVKRKARNSLTTTSASSNNLVVDKENAVAASSSSPLPSSDAMRLVARAYAQTLACKASEVKALAAELDVLMIASAAARSPAPPASPRAPLQLRDTNREQLASPMAKQVVLSPRTLLVPSTMRAADLRVANEARLSLQQPEQAAVAPIITVQCDDECEESLTEDDTPTPVLLAPTTPSVRKVDSTHSLPSPYVTINPDLLRDAAWNFRDLQLLCMRLGLGGRGTRDQLVERLLAWHRKCFHKREPSEEDEEDDHPLSIRKRMKHASNFSLLQFDTSSMLQGTDAAPAAAAAPSTPPLSPFNDDHANGPLTSVTVASSLPALLTPLLYKTAPRRYDGTPRSILSDSKRPKSSKRLSFSVFNGVKLIPSRAVSNEELNATPSPTKTLCMDEGDEDAMDSSHIEAPLFEELPPAVVEPIAPRPSFLSSVSNAIMTALSPRKLAPPQQQLSLYPHTSSTFTFDRLPSIEARHGDESESDLSMEM